MSLTDKTILLTGGTGSFGQKFTEVVLRNHNPKVIRIFSRGEWLQQQMRQKFKDGRLRFFLGDVRDRERIYRAMHGVDIVVHAAALKQIDTCEYNPIEAVKTNIDGAVNLIDAAIDNGVSKVMALSTDKAAHPVNLYGATKLVAERLFSQANVYTGGRQPRFSLVRYGNVVGSRGSVVPIFQEQIRTTGEITITDERKTRFWISLEQGVNFVIRCIDMMRGGEVFVPKLPSMRITEFAEALAPGVKQNIIGIRPGEKLHEVLLCEEEARHALEFEDHFVIEPESAYWQRPALEGGQEMEPGYSYASDANPESLTPEELRKIVGEL